MPAPDAAELLPGPVLPGLVNAHSHAFQRAFAGLAERREGEHDDFWSWRDRMYRVALAISPDQLRAVAAMLYRELLRGGYTQVCEFHYLQHQPSGAPYADALPLARRLLQVHGDRVLWGNDCGALYPEGVATQVAMVSQFALWCPHDWRLWKALCVAHRRALRHYPESELARMAFAASFRCDQPGCAGRTLLWKESDADEGPCSQCGASVHARDA